MKVEEQLLKMRQDWDARARENARYYVNTERDDWTDAEFFASGRQTVQEEILTDMINICQEKDPSAMRVLDSVTFLKTTQLPDGGWGFAPR